MLRAAILAITVSNASVLAQNDVSKLEPVFTDDFGKDSRADYKTDGDVSWEPGRLTLAEGASIERVIVGGPWTKVTLRSTQAPLFEAQPRSELRVWLLLDGAANCCVSLRRTRENGRTTASIALVTTVEVDGNPVEQVVRERRLATAEFASVDVEYRQGLVRVALSSGDAFAGYIGNVIASVRGIAVRSVSTASELASFAAATERVSQAEYSEVERQQLQGAQADEEESDRLHRQGKFAESAKLGERSLEIRRKILGEQHPTYAATLNSLGLLYKNMGDVRRAEAMYTRCRDVQQKILGEDHPAYATTLHNLAALYRLMGEYARAEPLYRRSRNIRRDVLGEQDSNYANSLNSLASLYKSTGEYARAEALYQQALQICESVMGRQHLYYARTLSNLAGLYEKLGDYPRAGARYRLASDIIREAVGEKHPDYARSLNNLAYFHFQVGDYAKAEPLYLQCVENARSVLGEQHPSFASSLNNLAALYLEQGDYSRAEPLLIQSRDLRRSVRGGNHPEHAGSLNNLAAFYHRTGRYGLAEPLFKKALEIERGTVGQQHPTHAATLNNLARLYFEIGDYGAAEPLYLQSRDIRKAVLGEQHPAYAGSLENLGTLYAGMGDDARAQSFATAAHDALMSSAALTLPALSAAETRSWAENRSPRTDLVLSVLRKSRQPAAVDPYSFVWNTKLMVSRLRIGQELSSRSSPEAKQVFGQLRDARLRLAALVTAEPGPRQADRYRQARAAASEKKEQLERQLAALNPGSNREIAIRDATVQNLLEQLPRGVAVVDFVRLYDRRYVDHEIEVKWEDGRSEKRTVRKQEAEPVYDAFVLRADTEPTPERLAQWVPLGPAQPIESAISAWRAAFSRDADDPSDVGAADSGSGKEATSSPDQILRTAIWEKLEPHLDGIHTVVLIPDAALNRVPWAALPGRKEGEYLLHDYALTTASSGQQLFGVLADPPIETAPSLLVAGGIQYDERPTSKRQKQTSARDDPDSSASTGRPLISSPNDVGWVFLEGTKREANTIADLWGERGTVRRLLETQADEHSLSRLLPSSRVAHLATHGYFDTKGEVYGTDLREQWLFDSALSGARRNGSVAYRNPLLMTGIVMAGANVPPEMDEFGLPTGEDGILTAEEISGLDLRNTELVTLSACETGLGEVAAGQGVYGLTRVLHRSGVRSVVASQWKVSDAATQALMEQFYTNLWIRQQSRSQALRNAQLWMLNSPDRLAALGVLEPVTRGDVRKRKPTQPGRAPAGRTSPYYWAAFTLSGDWR